jgi:transposase
MDSKAIFELGLGINKPWYIKEVKLSTKPGSSQKEMHIEIDFQRGSKFIDKKGEECSVYDTSERSWQHLNFFEYPCYIKARVPRIIDKDGKVKTIDVPWSRAGSGFTLMFEAFAMLLIESEMPVNKAAHILRVYAQRIWNLFNYWVEEAKSKEDLREVKIIGIDETSRKKGHSYLTVAVDMEERKVIDVQLGKDAQTVGKIKSHIEKQGGKPGAIEQVCMDMSPAFISGTGENFPNAQITFDKFHVLQMSQNAMDELRKLERKEYVSLKGYKYLFLKNQNSLTNEEESQLTDFVFAYPRLGVGYRFKELLKEFYNIPNPEEAEGFLAYWCDAVQETDIISFKNLAKTIKAHWTGIINYTKSKLTNGILEGINNKIQLAKRRARGYRNTRNFINMINFICGKLSFAYPQYFT